MSASTRGPSSRGRILYYFLIAVIAAAAVFLVTVLPTPVLGPALVAAAVLVAITDRLFRPARSPSRLRNVPIAYAVILAVVVVGSFAAAWTLGRDAASPWLGWALAVVVFLVLFSGAWTAKAPVRTATG